LKNIKLLLLIPFIGMLGFLPLANRAEPFVLGLPFLLFWIVLWILLSFVILAVVYKLDPDNKEGDVE
jgi:O-antigen/teichoic acid export membrane protein